MRVLAIGAHPDDLEILCGGTLARYAAGGHDVVMAHVASGCAGGKPGDDAAELIRLRDGEARSAAELAGARHVSVGIPDGAVWPEDHDQRRALIELVRASNPDVVLTHHPDDYHCDHRDVSRLVFTASFLAANPMVEGAGDAPGLAASPPLFYMDNLVGLGFTPTEYVDVSDFMDTKREMLRCHASQLVYLHETFGSDILEQIETCTRFRGLQCGVTYAEAFAPCLTWLRPRPFRLLP